MEKLVEVSVLSAVTLSSLLLALAIAWLFVNAFFKLLMRVPASRSAADSIETTKPGHVPVARP